MQNKELKLMLDNSLIPSSAETEEIIDIVRDFDGRESDFGFLLMRVFTYGVIQGKRKERKRRLSNSTIKGVKNYD